MIYPDPRLATPKYALYASHILMDACTECFRALVLMNCSQTKQNACSLLRTFLKTEYISLKQVVVYKTINSLTSQKWN